MTDAALIWSYLSRDPLVWLAATLAAYWIGDRLSLAVGRKPWANPVLIAVLLLAVLLVGTGTPYRAYFEGAQFVHFLLGPATVSLAVPLWRNAPLLKRAALPVLAALFAGSVTAIVVALAVAAAFGVDDVLLATVAAKSATAPVAIGVAERMGGEPTLAAVLVLMTGLIGALVATPLLNALRVTDWRARGLSIGVAAHGLGTARAFQVNPTAGTFAGLGMGLNAILTALIAPWLLRLFL